jgi:hypothetical protein
VSSSSTNKTVPETAASYSAVVAKTAGEAISADFGTRQEDIKRGAPSRSAYYIYRTPMRVDDPVHDSQPQPAMSKPQQMPVREAP